MAERERDRVGGDLARRARAEVDEPGALRRDARRPRIERALPVEQASEVERAQARARLGEHGGGAGDHGGGGARAVDRAVARRAVVVGARLGGRERDARARPGRA